MIVSGMNHLSLLDYPDKLSCIIFTQGCNYKCGFCQNSDLINYDKNSLISEDEIFAYLNKRKKVLDGLVISGGEPSVQSDLKEFIKKVKKETNLLIKLDTNGSNPNILKELIDEKLIDYVAMDVKNIFDEYYQIVNIKNVDISKIKQSINILKESNIDHEFRTTIMKNYHSLDKILKICDYLGGGEKYYLQNFEDSSAVLDKTLVSFTKEELKDLQEQINKKYPNVKVRGL